MRTFFKIFLALLVCASSIGAYLIEAKVAAATNHVFTNNLTVGIRGDDVSALQQLLISKGFLKIISPTGYFGTLTKTALGAWQKSESISPAVGFFGPISRAKINTIISQIQIPITPQPETPISEPVIATVSPQPTTVIATTTVNGIGLPSRFKIPKINVDANILSLGLAPDGIMEIPQNIVEVGWFNGSPRPGEKGSSIITGHVAQIRGGIMTKPGVFMELNKLVTGDRLYVVNDKGESITFVVRESRLYDPTADASNVFSANDNGVHLNLITCEGTWNPAEQSYSKRLVIFTDLEN